MQVNKKNIVKIVLDALMALVFAILFNKSALGGMLFHEVAGLAIGMFIVFHMVLNRAWLKGVTKKLFNKKLPARTRAAYIIDALLLTALAVIIVTGILMSRELFPNLFNIDLNVEGLHKSVSYIALLLAGAHLGLSWNRVVAIVKKLLKLPKKRALGAVATACAIAAFMLGSYNIVSTGYFNKVASISSGFSESEGGEHSFGQSSESAEEASAVSSSSITASTVSADAVSSASLNGGSQSGAGGNYSSDDTSLSAQGGGQGLGNGSGKQNGGGGQGSVNVLSTIYQNLSIMAAFAVFTYYIDKLFKKKPKKTGERTAV